MTLFPDVFATISVDEFIMENTHYPLHRCPDNTFRTELWVECDKKEITRQMAKQILKEENPDGEYMLKLGHIPLIITPDMAVAKSVLLPGMWGTPERETYKALGGPSEPPTFAEMASKRDFSVLAHLHEKGFEQMRRIP